MEDVPPCTPVAFPATTGNKRTFKFKKFESTFTMSRDVYQEFYRRGCVDVDPIPAMDLQNDIHAIFRPEAFRGLTAEQYTFIRPALTLASRFITDEAYMEYWAHLCSAQRVEDSARELSGEEDKPGHILRANPDISANEAVGMARTALAELATNLTFFFFDDVYSSRVKAAGEAFAGDMHRICRYNEDVHNGCVAGQCRWCDDWPKLRCAGCRGTLYEGETVEELQEAARARELTTKARTTRGLVAALKQQDLANDGIPSQETNGQVPNRDNMSNLQIGLLQQMYQHIQKATSASPQEIWSGSSELRFQFAVATTLCHELVHVFWWWTQRRCLYCERREPWWSGNEEKVLVAPELGEEWEWWALGSRVPAAGKLQETPQEKSPTVFSQSNWCHTFETKTGGFSYVKGCVSHVYIFPVEWTNSWFQEATWTNICDNGREAGRPTHDNLVILSELGTNMINDDEFDTFKCEIEDYSHPELVAQGGFESEKIKPALYGKSKMKSDEDILQYMNKLLRKKVEKRNTRVVKASKKGKGKGRVKKSQVSTYRLNTKRKIVTNIK
ncbi:hypothetical protein PTNB85_09071 [Pyrenophora teres f. teres]|uniref:Uncharacterized protein n=1 Tax=Pyrenophora teres f. teres TaxID=97479 RepID=A0A6S6VE66_9PLEO|nr:hypothetical protein HRS9139_10086 [Pyrenophora teres f. teres]KAE8826126.1 hypothetical protein PTNB85_09071 [Pyrenophora teres f. teres]KAE8852815.1 hypothetical protein PTNB29_10205 [Pyrenophora teres f. teres]CAE7001274.1 hypothetical protein PTTW11_01217 [Pyrenophora teres f. teres]